MSSTDPSPQRDPVYPPPHGQPVYPPPQGQPVYPLDGQASSPTPQPFPASPAPARAIEATGPSWDPPQPGWAPPPLGAGSSTWAPLGQPTTVAPPEAPFAPTYPSGWPPPGGFPPPPGTAPAAPGYYPPANLPGPPRHRAGRLMIAAVLALLLIAGVALAVTQPWRPAPASDQPTVEVTGGDLGRPVDLTGPDGSGTVTVTTAHWTTEGEVAPEPGARYLVVSVDLAGGEGELTTGAVFTAVVAQDGQRFGISYGPVLDPLLPSRTLHAGETGAGKLGYQLPPGPVRLEFQAPDGVTLGSVAIPGP